MWHRNSQYLFNIFGKLQSLLCEFVGKSFASLRGKKLVEDFFDTNNPHGYAYVRCLSNGMNI
jgi:hypothetical protein